MGRGKLPEKRDEHTVSMRILVRHQADDTPGPDAGKQPIPRRGALDDSHPEPRPHIPDVAIESPIGEGPHHAVHRQPVCWERGARDLPVPEMPGDHHYTTTFGQGGPDCIERVEGLHKAAYGREPQARERSHYHRLAADVLEAGARGSAYPRLISVGIGSGELGLNHSAPPSQPVSHSA